MSFYLINKPLHFTSFDVIQFLRGKLKISKIGHTGTLDPLATGALLVATGKDTKLIPYFEKDIKEYYFSVNFDGKTASYDLGTEVKYTSLKEQKKTSKYITKEKIKSLLKEKFTGEIFQIPPKYSAIKIGGKRALNKVLNQEDFEMQKRQCKIYEIELLSLKYQTASFRALVSPGTYIRSIANDLGNLLGTGGYVIELKRTKIGELNVDLAQDLDNFDKDKTLDIRKLFKKKKFIELNPKILEKLNNGMKIKGKFDYPQDIEMFVLNWGEITNIVKYIEEYLIPIKKL